MSNIATKPVDPVPKPLQTVSAQHAGVTGVAFLPGGGRVVSCSYDKNIRVWNVTNGEEEELPIVNDDFVTVLFVTKDGGRIAAAGLSFGSVNVWSAQSYELLETWPGDTSHNRFLDVSLDSGLVAGSDDDGIIVIRDGRSGETINQSTEASAETGLYTLRFSPDGKRLASGYSSGTFRIFDTTTGNLVLGPAQAHNGENVIVRWSLDGRRLFTATKDGAIGKWDLELESEAAEASGVIWTSQKGEIRDLCPSPDGRRLAIAYTQDVRFWDVESGGPVGGPLTHEGEPRVVTFSPTGEFVAVGYNRGGVHIWRVPWWDETQKHDAEAHTSFLDLPATTNPFAEQSTDLPPAAPERKLDFLDFLATNRPSTSQVRPHGRDHRTNNPSSRTPKSNILSWRLWGRIPRLFSRRSGDGPAKTSVHAGRAKERDYAAPIGDEEPEKRPTEPLPTAVGDYPGFSIIEMNTSSDSLPEPPASAHQSDRLNADDHISIRCCGMSIFSR
ncbi:hypothetical protein HYDPIDRAFT_28692 [Hydnomerulius pinastri MD-312]|uniref:Unplaced genomic scaffold scaffold_13, whole genome shotgun sequence n=1 Tax=Hydnomerulius pinastri MD-312 TaxID=994086 RepID=A0A0C9WEV4_9AGAM|nr:hypothetical protein HYDPIDRAFT_28692 [Hydnomerulius pinastri MD-312]